MPSYYLQHKEVILENLRNKRIPADNLGRIYRIFSRDKCYIGSTKNVPELRFRLHRNAYSSYKRGSGRYCASFEVFDSDENPQFEVLEKCPINSLPAREEYFISKFRGTTQVVNRNSANCKTNQSVSNYMKQYQAQRRFFDPTREYKRLAKICVD